MEVDCVGTPRNVHIMGFFEDGCTRGQRCAGEALIRSVERLGCKGVKDVTKADFIFVNIRSETRNELKKALEPYAQRQVVFLFKEEQSRQDFNADGFDYEVTCLHRPILPSTLRMLLFQPETARKMMGVKPARDLKAVTPPTQDGLMGAIQQDEQQTALPPTTLSLAGPSPAEKTVCPTTIPVLVVEDNRIVSWCIFSSRTESLKVPFRIEPENLGAISQEDGQSRPLSKVLYLTLNLHRAFRAEKQSMAKRRSKYSRTCMKLASVSIPVSA